MRSDDMLSTTGAGAINVRDSTLPVTPAPTAQPVEPTTAQAVETIA